MNIQTKKEKDTLIITVSGRMDAVTSPEFEKSFAEIVSRGDKAFIIDLCGVDYISSAGLRGILTSVKRVHAVQGKLAFTGIQGQVQEVFKISGFLTMLKVFSTETEALAQM